MAAVYTVDRFERTADDIMGELRPAAKADDGQTKAHPKPERKRVWASITHNADDVIVEAFDDAARRKRGQQSSLCHGDAGGKIPDRTPATGGAGSLPTKGLAAPSRPRTSLENPRATRTSSVRRWYRSSSTSSTIEPQEIIASVKRGIAVETLASGKTSDDDFRLLVWAGWLIEQANVR